MKIKVLVVFGTRPEAIKMASVVRALKANNECFETTVCVTGQHRHMLDQVLDIFDITPDVDLNLMKVGQDLFDITSGTLIAMRKVIHDAAPDIVLVHGDTTTAMATAISAFYLGVKVGHVEAGLRTYDLQAPFPEEFNRQLVSKLTSLHFAPTNESMENLIEERESKNHVCVTGNTVIDSLFWMIEKIESSEQKKLFLQEFFLGKIGFDIRDTRYILITGHRRENLGNGFDEIFKAISELARKYPSVSFVYPVHLNPKVQMPAHMQLGTLPNVCLIEPLNYEAFVYLLSNCYILMTDSGGLQEEAPSLGKPVLVMRDVTERPEALKAGTVKLVGCDKSRIIENISTLLDDEKEYTAMAVANNPFGDGTASSQIVQKLKEYFHGQKN